MYKRLFIVFLLGFSSGLPLSLLTSTLQAWFSASGLSLMATGMLSLVGLPYIYRAVWGPVVDSYFFKSFGRRRTWMFITQIGLCIGFNSMAWMSPESSPVALSVLALCLAFLS